jgi:hypothetical protein
MEHCQYQSSAVFVSIAERNSKLFWTATFASAAVVPVICTMRCWMPGWPGSWTKCLVLVLQEASSRFILLFCILSILKSRQRMVFTAAKSTRQFPMLRSPGLNWSHVCEWAYKCSTGPHCTGYTAVGGAMTDTIPCNKRRENKDCSIIFSYLLWLLEIGWMDGTSTDRIITCILVYHHRRRRAESV